jgi:alpha-galactosidase
VALGLSFLLLDRSLLLPNSSHPHSWTLANDAVKLTVGWDAQGRLALTQLRDLRTGYDWCRARTPSTLFQVQFLHIGDRFTLTGRSEYDLLAHRLTHESDGSQLLRIRVRARQYPLELELYWRLRPGLSPIEKWYTVTNRGKEPITLLAMDTFSHQVQIGDGQTVWYVHKGTAAPGTLQVSQSPLADGQSQSVLCSAEETHDLMESVPWFLLDRGNGQGGLLFGWAFSAEGRFDITREAGTARVTGGLRPDTFKQRLMPGATLAAPTGFFGPYAGSTDDGANEWHRFLQRYWSPAAAGSLTPRVDYNTWYSLGLKADEASCLRQLRAAADLGAEVFHLDAGWYRAPGDWRPDPKRFPHGLRPLVEEAHRRGMRFGLWVAFTQIGEEMLKQHPVWITTPGQQIDPHRPFSYRTLTICLGNPAARAWIQRELERIVTEYHVDMLEYDQPIIEECTARNHGHDPGAGSYAATLGFYELYDWLHLRFPRLMLENCMDGGHIMDFGVLRRTSFTSITDFADALHNRVAVYGATYPWPAFACETYMQDNRRLPAEYLFRSFMMGRWTISADVAAWSPETRETARHHIALYKQLRPLIRDGDVYHILPQATGRQWDGLEYYDRRRGEGVAFVFRPRCPHERQAVKLAGLEPADYEVQIEGQSASRRLTSVSLEQEGIEISLPERNSAAIIHVRRLPWTPSLLARLVEPDAPRLRHRQPASSVRLTASDAMRRSAAEVQSGFKTAE